MAECNSNDNKILIKTKPRPAVEPKIFRIVDMVLTPICTDQDRNIKTDSELMSQTPCSDLVDYTEHRESKELTNEGAIMQECLSFIKKVSTSLSYLTDLNDELTKELVSDVEMRRRSTVPISDIQSLSSAFENILDTVDKIESKTSGSFHLYDVWLEPSIASIMNVYKPFMKNYSSNSEWINDFSDIRNRSSLRDDRPANANVSSSLYTVFNSIFAFELILDRYRSCFMEASEDYERADEALNVIWNLLADINSSEDQKATQESLKTQKELSLMSGRMRPSKMHTRFLLKGAVFKNAKVGNHQVSKQLILFSDCLYVTSSPLIIDGASFVEQELSIDFMGVTRIQRHVNPSTRRGIAVNAREAVEEFFFDNELLMETWTVTLLLAIQEEDSRHTPVSPNDSSFMESLGLEAPRWQSDDAAGYCNGHKCHKKFTAVLRRHHCRADGLLYCSWCSSYKLKLKFKEKRETRVCDLCFMILGLYKNNTNLMDISKKLLLSVMRRKERAGIPIGWVHIHCFKWRLVTFGVRCYGELDLRDGFARFYERYEDKYSYLQFELFGLKITTAGGQSPNSKVLSPEQFIIENRDGNEQYCITTQGEEECRKFVELLSQYA